jgi:hypothetical protein
VHKNSDSLVVACSRYGAEIGRRSIFPSDAQLPVVLRLVRLNWVDCDYDAGGAYWGWQEGTHIYRACGPNVDVYVRAKTRTAAKQQIRTRLPLAVFRK